MGQPHFLAMMDLYDLDVKQRRECPCCDEEVLGPQALLKGNLRAPRAVIRRRKLQPYLNGSTESLKIFMAHWVNIAQDIADGKLEGAGNMFFCHRLEEAKRR